MNKVMVVPLEPFVHQVGGHYPMVSLDSSTICKQLDERELKFYQTMPDMLLSFTPEFKGTMKVDTEQDDNGYIILRGEPPISYDNISTPPSSKLVSKIKFKKTETLKIEHSEDFCNPWALKVHRDHLRKFLQGQTSAYYLLLENVVSKFKHPCILDLKIGTRQYSDDVSAAKKQRKITKVKETTSSTLGLRLCGVQSYNQIQGTYICHNKYYGRSLTPVSFSSTIQQFLTNSSVIFRKDVLKTLIVKLKELNSVISKLDTFRFYTSSLLVSYDGHVPKEILDNKTVSNDSAIVDVRIIDFAHSTHQGLMDSVSHSGPDSGFLFGLKNFISILEHFE